MCTLQGQFCDQCETGYFRSSDIHGPFDPCTRCFCHNHEESYCDRDTGVCQCTHNTTGPQCQYCQPGFYGNAAIGRPSIANISRISNLSNRFFIIIIITITTTTIIVIISGISRILPRGKFYPSFPFPFTLHSLPPFPLSSYPSTFSSVFLGVWGRAPSGCGSWVLPLENWCVLVHFGDEFLAVQFFGEQFCQR